MKASYEDSIWILEKSSQPRYTPAEVCRLTGIAPHSLQNWANRGLLKPKSNRPGKGGTRLYDKTQLCAVKLAQSVLSLGAEPAAALIISTKLFSGLILNLRKASLPGGSKKAVIDSVFSTVAVVRPSAKGEPQVVFYDLKSPIENMLSDKFEASTVIWVGLLLFRLIQDEAELSENFDGDD